MTLDYSADGQPVVLDEGGREHTARQVAVTLVELGRQLANARITGKQSAARHLERAIEDRRGWLSALEALEID